MLSAILVHKPNVATGQRQPDALKGFIAAARSLGHVVHDESPFLSQQQKRVFEWTRGLGV